jgi:four helix bundle protein
MKPPTLTPSGKPFDLHERLLLFACDVVRAVEFLHKRGMVGRALSNQLLSAGTSVGSNYEESDGASSSADFVAKNRIALKEAKETRFRLRVCRRTDLLDARFDSLVQESDEIVRILATIVHKASRRRALDDISASTPGF